jgi:hypothetical protein
MRETASLRYSISSPNVTLGPPEEVMSVSVLLAADLQHRPFLDLAGQHRLGLGDGRVAGDDGKLGGVDELGQHGRAVVELVIADGHGVETDCVHELDCVLALVGGVEQRAGELVARVEHDHVAALGRQGVAPLVDLGRHARRAAEAVTGRLVLVRTGGVGRVDRLHAGMEVVDVQDVEREIGEGLRRRDGKRRCGQRRDHG